VRPSCDALHLPPAWERCVRLRLTQRARRCGFAVIDDVAYFGISKWGTRRERDDENKASEARALRETP